MLELCWVLSAKGKRLYKNKMKQNIILDLRWFTIQRERYYKQAAMLRGIL